MHHPPCTLQTRLGTAISGPLDIFFSFLFYSLLHSALPFGFATEGSSTISRQPIRIPAKHRKYTRGSCVAAFRVVARFRPMEGSLFHGR
ncbi:hypothetical protein J3E68DRAFT_399355 [Trichoderma sp. SZMC 28012]